MNILNFKKKVSYYEDQLNINAKSIELLKIKFSVSSDPLSVLHVLINNVCKHKLELDYFLAWGETYYESSDYAKPGIVIHNMEKAENTDIEFVWTAFFSLDGDLYLFITDSDAVSTVINKLFGEEECFNKHFQMDSYSIEKDAKFIEPFTIIFENEFF
ncbi:hypothetical protein MTBBW1_1980009 [Desulfamplus magnetovallimortis]|uniref:Uncharacterized protein n=1 Tax=Desulfamplus magnetovallimortis TaxID=1246637 RepID=A0A1W1HBC4_9BACT|nr:hypothetical protein [Desulfamplus magnetovallimortis]SLM29787.1 hypothetical protein MTBBW1_1980009 [Desulfamplus magnetovallimortis]